MTITLSPNQEEAIRAAIRAGQVSSLSEFIDHALAGLPPMVGPESADGNAAEQGLGLFSSPEDAALLDEVVSLAYAERHRPSRRNPSL